MTAATGRPPTTRETIAPDVAKLHAEGHGRNEIARQLDCSPSTVTKAAEIAGVTFDRTATVQATEAAKLDAKARRSRLAVRWLDIAEQALDAISPHNPRDARDLAVVAGVATDKSLRLDEFDNTDSDYATVDVWLAAMLTTNPGTER
ncbi:helix-turn-helix domain-containing protein [Rhodococcus pseudokoreensis]|uniref:Helix-turn-helix domain-containing protein n=1 Tax=Rhodococcus pseudokoreensis TaxID=2811421 RepID=A0A974ZU25_9NOCA|nr:helix-turn-helix domain-containing protein [Rhodococcus pseudokoreensis]QSE90309.1 helix-turn-helix domain-containing protein [Rhodococcus pseudokoreensis]